MGTSAETMQVLVRRPLTSFFALAAMLLLVPGYEISDKERTAVAEAFASLGNGGPSLPKSQLRPLVSSVVERSSNGKFSPEMHRKHVDFLMTGGKPTILRERVWWGSLCPRLCRISGHKPRAGLYTRTVPNQHGDTSPQGCQQSSDTST